MNTKRTIRKPLNFRIPIDVLSGFRDICNLNFMTMSSRVIWLLKEDIKNQNQEFIEHQINTQQIKKIASDKLNHKLDYTTWESSF